MSIKSGEYYLFHTTETDLKQFNGTALFVIRPLTEKEADLEEVGNMYRVKFANGLKWDVFEDELSPLTEEEHRKIIAAKNWNLSQVDFLIEKMEDASSSIQAFECLGQELMVMIDTMVVNLQSLKSNYEMDEKEEEDKQMGVFTIVNGIEVDLSFYTHDKAMIQKLSTDEEFISAVSSEFEYEFTQADEDVPGGEVLEQVVEKLLEEWAGKLKEEETNS